MYFTIDLYFPMFILNEPLFTSLTSDSIKRNDLKVSHKSKDEIMKLVNYIKGKYGEGLTVHDGHVHDYLGVDHDYSEKGVVKMSMMKHIDIRSLRISKKTRPCPARVMETDADTEAGSVSINKKWTRTRTRARTRALR